MFMELMRRRNDAYFYAFDLLWLNGVDLRPLPLLDRKAELRKLVLGKPGILYADYLKGAAVELFRVCWRRTWRAWSSRRREDLTMRRRAVG
jgi:bifunctional non-homologous end joining protein LigD